MGLLVGDDMNSQLLDTRPYLFPVVEEAVLMLRMFGHVEESLRELCLCQERITCLINNLVVGCHNYVYMHGNDICLSGHIISIEGLNIKL